MAKTRTMDMIIAELDGIQNELAQLQRRKDALEHEQQMLWPKRMRLSAYVNSKHLRYLGDKCGLTPEAAERFVRIAKLSLVVDVTLDGHVTIVTCNGQPCIAREATNGL